MSIEEHKSTPRQARTWIDRVTRLRTRFSRYQRRGTAGQHEWAQVADEALSVCASAIDELAGQHLACERLQQQVRLETAAWDHLFDVMPVAGVMTDRNGAIQDANRAAASLLNVGREHLRGRFLLLFLKDRDVFAALMKRIAQAEDTVSDSLTLRPRERRAVKIDIIGARLTPGGPAIDLWLWFLTPQATQIDIASAPRVRAGRDRLPDFGTPQPALSLRDRSQTDLQSAPDRP